MAQQQSSISDTQIQALNEALEQGVSPQVSMMLNSLSSADIAHLLESSPPKIRTLIWQLLEKELAAEVLQELGDDLRQFYLEQMNVDEVAALTENIDTDDLADMLQLLPDTITRQVLASMDAQDRHRVEQVLSYPEDTAGGLMNTDMITVRPSNTLDVVFRYLRRHPELPEMTDALLVVNRRDEFIGVLPISKMLTTHPSISVREVMQTDIQAIPANMPANKVAQLFERQDLVSAPVMDDEGKLVGRITVDDVVDVIREEGEHSLMSMAGLDEDADTFAPVLKTARSRAIWLGINLLTAFIASGVIGMFQDTIDKVVALAVLMPIVASMGGIAGSQTLTLVIRAMALGQIGQSNVRWLISRECIVGFLNGCLWAVVVSIASMLWFKDPIISAVIALAMVVNLLIAAIAGAGLPLLLKAMRIDPALAGSVVLTTITDVVGFVAFLGLASYFFG
ncbi:magnesium transporter [Zooshikella harenae]|uniref:Magnesium transporter MgtE n=1 Tax=Zooshikella harenae TaxID=2827238 RepID=A0ABS5Z7R2_9GAMM|nr:magnesium transporter [Zooshikella harenae]MBU2710081.1 magnesium transporter [Zooshikella harenae]